MGVSTGVGPVGVSASAGGKRRAKRYVPKGSGFGEDDAYTEMLRTRAELRRPREERDKLVGTERDRPQRTHPPTGAASRSEKVDYDLSQWSREQRRQLRFALVGQGIPHQWHVKMGTLTVPGQYQAAMDRAIARRASQGEPPRKGPAVEAGTGRTTAHASTPAYAETPAGHAGLGPTFNLDSTLPPMAMAHGKVVGVSGPPKPSVESAAEEARTLVEKPVVVATAASPHTRREEQLEKATRLVADVEKRIEKAKSEDHESVGRLVELHRKALELHYVFEFNSHNWTPHRLMTFGLAMYEDHAAGKVDKAQFEMRKKMWDSAYRRLHELGRI